MNEDFDFIIRILIKGLYVYGIDKKQTNFNLYKNSLTRSDENQDFVYFHQKKFIKKASKLGYFSNNEFRQRKKYIELRFARFKLGKLKLISFAVHFFRYLFI